MINATREFLHRTLFKGGACAQFMHAADELIHSARVLRSDLEVFKKAPDPFGSLLSTMHNNHEFEKFPERPVDTPGERV